MIYYNKDIINKNLTDITNELDENHICCAIGCNDYANSNITLRVGTRIFNLKVCHICKKKLEK